MFLVCLKQPLVTSLQEPRQTAVHLRDRRCSSGGLNPMPCGGIHPIDNDLLGTIRERLDSTQGGCWVCSRGGAMHFCHEWDTFIHARCVPRFLATDQGQLVIEHEHTILLDFSLEEDSAISQMCVFSSPDKLGVPPQGRDFRCNRDLTPIDK